MSTPRQLDISQITDHLYIAAWPKSRHAAFLTSLNVRLIISMLFFEPMARELSQPPFRLLRLRTIDSPLFPMPISYFFRGVEAALPVFARDESVLIHCRGGVHRSVAMASCILIGQGYPADDAMRLIKERRPVADPYAWYIKSRILKFERAWKAAKDQAG